MIGYVLFPLAVVLMAMLSPIAVVYNTFRSLFHGGNRLHYLAILIDQMGNVLFGPLFNDILIHPSGYQFGHYRETISYVLGRNQETKTLKKLGKAIVIILD